jgi:WD40 repeat protein/serine/threonine protein kinase
MRCATTAAVTAGEDRILETFRQRFAYDLGLGRLKPVEEYQRMFRGFDEAVAREYARLDQEARRAQEASAAAAVAEPGVPAGGETSRAPDRIGPYRLLRELGRGGQAVVHLAEDTRLSRNVALKVFAPGLLPSEQFLARFRREVELASRLDHPGVCTVYEAGTDGDTPYIAMRYVEGTTLAHCIDTSLARTPQGRTTSALDLPEPAATSASGRLPEVLRVAALVERTARALHAAHEAGLIHRDVKPGNVMVTKDGEPVLLDFGLARDDAQDHALTMTGTLLGTPAYMSPEQLLAQRVRLDRRTDVYSLGVTLYECLTLRRPFDAPTREGLYQQILASEADPPRRANAQIPKDLEVVLLTAMERNRDRRYQTALDFAEDLRRVREHEPIRARPTPALVRLGRWAQRHPAIATGLTTALLALSAGLGIATHYLHEVSRAQEDTLAALRHARSVAFKSASAEAQDRDPMRALLLAREAARVEPSPAVLDRLRMAVALSHERLLLRIPLTSPSGAEFSPDGTMIATASTHDQSRRGQVEVWDAVTGRRLHVLLDDRPVSSVDFSPDGRRIVTGWADRTARVHDVASGAELVRLRGHEDEVNAAHFSPDGLRIATSSLDGTARIWDAATGAPLLLLKGHAGGLCFVLWSEDGARVVTSGQDGTARIWDAATGSELVVLRESATGHCHAYTSPDGSRVVVGGADTPPRVRDAKTGAELLVLDGTAPGTDRFAFSPDGARLAAVGPKDGVVRVWDVTSGREVSVLRGHEVAINSAIFSPDGLCVATASADRTARLWDVESGKPLATFLGHENEVFRVRFSPDGLRILTAGADGTVRVWDASAAKSPRVLRGHSGELQRARFCADGAAILSVSFDRTARLWNAATETTTASVRHDRVIWSAALSRDGARLVTASVDRTARIWDAASGRELAVLHGHADIVTDAAFSPDGGRVVTASFDKSARLWDAATGKELHVLRGHENIVRFAAFTPDGGRVITASVDGTVRHWDAATGRELGVRSGHTADMRLFGMRFSPDGTRFVTASEDRTARVWDAASGEVLLVLNGHGGPVAGAAFSPDGTRIVTASGDSTARVWDAATGKELQVLRGHDGGVKTAEFSPDGTRVVTAGGTDRNVRLWDAANGKVLAILVGHEGGVTSAEFSPDGSQILTASRDTTLRIWPARAEDPIQLADAGITRDFSDTERGLYGDLLGGAK